MKKIFLFLTLLLISSGLSLNINQTYAESNNIEVRVSEKVPGANCTDPDDKGVYTCNLQTGFWATMQMIGRMIKYATFIASLSGVLFIVINGILYSMSGMDAGLKDEAKKRIVKTLLGLVVLLLSGVILNAIAPWVYVV